MIGAGPAGLACAAYVQEKGKRVLVLDAGKKPGGAGVHATGDTAFDTRWEREAGVPPYMGDYVRTAMTLTKNQLDYRLVSNAFHANTEFFDWSCGFGEPEKVFSLVDSPKGKSPRMTSHIPAGRYMCEKLAARCEELGVEIRMEHRARQLLRPARHRL